MEPIKFRKIIFLFIFISNYSIADDILQDLYKSFYEKHKGETLFSEDQILTYEVDLNGDGRNEVFISDTSIRMSNSKAGRFWDLYVSVPNGYQFYDNGASISFNIGTPTAKLSDGKIAIISYWPSNVESGGIYAYYLDKQNHLHQELISQLNGYSDFATAYQDAVKNKIVSDNIPIVRSTKKLEDVYTLSEIENLGKIGDDFFYKYNFRADAAHPGSMLVYTKADNKLVGTYKAGQFVPLSNQTNISTPSSSKKITPTTLQEDIHMSLNKNINHTDNRYLYFILGAFFIFSALFFLYKWKYKK